MESSFAVTRRGAGVGFECPHILERGSRGIHTLKTAGRRSALRGSSDRTTEGHHSGDGPSRRPPPASLRAPHDDVPALPGAPCRLAPRASHAQACGGFYYGPLLHRERVLVGLQGVAKIGEFRTVLGCHLTQGSLKSLSLPTIFQADDEGSIPFTRSNYFNYLVHVAPRVDTQRAVGALNYKRAVIAE